MLLVLPSISVRPVNADWLLRLTVTHKRWVSGFVITAFIIHKVTGGNHKRIYRIYRELELNLRFKPRGVNRRRIKRDKPDALSVPDAINQVFSMDYMSDTLDDGVAFVRLTFLMIITVKDSGLMLIFRCLA